MFKFIDCKNLLVELLHCVAVAQAEELVGFRIVEEDRESGGGVDFLGVDDCLGCGIELELREEL